MNGRRESTAAEGRLALEHRPPTTTVQPDPRRWVILAVLSASLLLIAMDATILNVALPTIATDMLPTSTELLWMVDAYSLILAGLLITAGTLADRLGRRRLLLVGFAMFAVASVVGATASTPLQLIIARALLGVGGALIMPSTLSILRNVFLDERERNMAIGIWSATAASGVALGPIVGGLLLENFAWGSVFLVNLPVVAIAFVLALRLIPESRAPSAQGWDAASAVLSLAGMVALVYGIKEGGKVGFDDPAALLWLASGAGLLAAFVRRQLALRSPLLDVRLFRNARFSIAAVVVLFSFFGLAALMLFLTQFFQFIQGDSPLESGLQLLPLAAGAAIGAPIGAVLLERVAARWVVAPGLLLVGLGLASISRLEVESGFGLIALSVTTLGFGAGLTTTAGSAAIMGTAPPERAGGAAAIQETAYELGIGLGVAILGSVMASTYREGLGDLSAPAEAVARAGESLGGAASVAAELGSPTGERLLAAAHTAFVDGVATTAWVGVAVVAVAAALSFVTLSDRISARAVAH